MHLLVNLRLVLLTAGTLLPFFWMVVILGHRRQRNFERVFFFLCLALTLFFGSSLLALNAELYYGAPPPALLRFAWTFLCLGLWFIPPLVVHLHAEYAAIRNLVAPGSRKIVWLLCAWLPAILLAPFLIAALQLNQTLAFSSPSRQLGLPFQIWLVGAVLCGAYWQRRFAKAAPDGEQQVFHKNLARALALLSVVLVVVVALGRLGPAHAAWGSLLAMIFALVPLVGLVGQVQRFNFLQIGRQRNLIYAVFMVFMALLYLSFVRRAGQWLEPYLPPEASAALLLFLPVVFFEPLQRVMGKLLRRTAQREVDRAQRLMGPINDVARRGDLEKLKTFSEGWIAEQLQLAEVRLEMAVPDEAATYAMAPKSSLEEVFVIARSGRYLGRLRAKPHGAMVSGEIYAALELVAEQLPSAFDLCRLIEEKLELDRELAERERLALVGQMAARISHSLKNPLGSIKTILQVQMESPELPPSMKQETQMVLDEIRRLSETLNQLLQFSRPGVRNRSAAGKCDAAQVAESVANMLRHEAENRGIALDVRMDGQSLEVAASVEVANDILSNLVLNALEATSRGGHVQVALGAHDGHCCVSVEDDGAGVPPALKEKILQPFFTTKARGTGLGLAIVARRLEEIGGTLKVDSPIEEERGSRFRALLPLAAKDTRS
ncbi:MAG TPA: ATP-binding protein [Candidatus Acidoferrum sp.]|jgi:signal transduction histidine kinase